MRFMLAAFVVLFLAGAQAVPQDYLGIGRSLKQSCYSYYQGTDWYGNDILDSAITVSSAYECCQKCSEYDNCVAYVFRSAYNHCWPKHAVGSPSPCEDCVGRNYQEPGTGGCSATYYSDRHGGDMISSPIITNDPGYCCQRCKDTNGCVSWTWRRDHHHCWLKNAKRNYVTCRACVSGDI